MPENAFQAQDPPLCMNSTSYDAVDYGILYCLQQDARMAITDIADVVNVSNNTVSNRIENLEDDGVIEGYQVNINYDEAGVQHYYVFIGTVRVSERERLAKKARQHSGVLEVITLMTGKQNLHIIGCGAEKDDMTDLAYDLDELGVEIEREYLIRDHSRQPYERFQLEHNI